jgi:hypothetical protein
MSREFSLILDGTTYKIVVDGNSILVNGQPFVVGFEEERVLVDGLIHQTAYAVLGLSCVSVVVRPCDGFRDVERSSL